MRKSFHSLLKHSLIFLVTTGYIYSQSGWMPSQTGFPYDYYSVHFEDNFTGWVCGSNGRILKTTNGGALWFQQISNSNVVLRSINFVSVTAGCVCGGYGTILKTVTGGNFWISKSSGTAGNLNNMFFISSTTGWIVGDSGVILKTTNAGDNWSRQQSGVIVSLKSIHFSSPNNGWAVGSSGKILKTTNGGSNWLVSIDLGSITNLHSVYFTDPVTGYIAGDYLTAQGKFVFFYKTITGGEWWLYQFSGVTTTMKSIYFANPLKGWAVGDSGVILGTINGGDNWIGQPSHTTNNLNTIFFTSPIYGWISGKSGTVLKTINGGFYDTLNTNRRDLGVIPLVINSSNVLDAKYRIIFRTPDTSYNVLRSLNNGISFDTIASNITLSDTGRAFDGLLVRVKRIKFRTPAPGTYEGNAGVVKDPDLPSDSIQTRYYGWDYFPPQNRYLEGSKYIYVAWKLWQSKSMSISYPTRGTYIGLQSSLKPEDLRKTKIVFCGLGSGQLAYRYYAIGNTNYQYQDMRQVPFKVYEIDETDGTSSPRQLNCAFLEFPDSLGGHHDGYWQPTSDSLGGKEILYIFKSSYSSVPDTAYTGKNLYLGMLSIDVMYVWSPKLITSGMNYHVNDEFYIYPYTVTRPEIAQGYPLYYEFRTYSLIGIQKISNKIPVSFMLSQNYPNPFNPKTKIKFSIPKINNNGLLEVNIKVYDILGREISELVNERLLPGEYETEFEGNNYSSGVYFYRLQAGEYFESKKMVLLK